jgi:hypothetical protein
LRERDLTAGLVRIVAWAQRFCSAALVAAMAVAIACSGGDF